MQIGVFIEYAGMVYDEADNKEHKIYGLHTKFLGTKDREVAERVAQEIYNNSTEEEKEMQIISVVLFNEKEQWPDTIYKVL